MKEQQRERRSVWKVDFQEKNDLERGRVTGGVRDEREGKKKMVRDGAREEMNRKGKGKILNEGEGLKEMGASEWRTV